MGLLALSGSSEFDRGDHIDQLPQALLVEAGAGVVLRQHALEAWVVALDRHHGVVHELADRRLLGIGLQVAPAGLGRNPEHVLGLVFVGVFRVGALVVAHACQQLGAVLFEAVGDVLEEDQAKHHVLVLGRVHVVAQLVGREPELGLEAQVGGAVAGGLGLAGGFGLCCLLRHRLGTHQGHRIAAAPAAHHDSFSHQYGLHLLVIGLLPAECLAQCGVSGGAAGRFQGFEEINELIRVGHWWIRSGVVGGSLPGVGRFWGVKPSQSEGPAIPQPRRTTTTPRLRPELLSVVRIACQRSARGTHTDG